MGSIIFAKMLSPATAILKNKERKLAQTFNSIFYYINDILCFVGARAQLHAFGRN
jgi:hypothetical protein